MKSKALLIVFALFIQSHAFAFSEFVGEYKYVSGPRETIGCGDMSVRSNQVGDGLELYFHFSDGYETVAYEFPAINKGKVDWVYNWGDGTARGKQKTVYSASKIVREVTQLGGLRKVRTDQLTLVADLLEIKSFSRDHDVLCVLKKK